MNEEIFLRIVEWRIENFSCWNGEIHDQEITSPRTNFIPYFTVNLYPKGLSGKDEHLVVLIRWSNPTSLLGELSYIGSDGSPLCKQQVDLQDVDVLELPPGPKFEEVVALIRENEALHGDRLTLRLRLKDDRKTVENMRTKIDAFRTMLKISSLHHFDEGHSLRFWIKYEEDKGLALDFSIIECSKMKLSLDPLDFEENISVFIRMTVLNNEDLVRTEENEHLFLDDSSEWVFSNSLTVEEVRMEGVSLILYIIIISKDKIKYHGGISYSDFSHTSVTMSSVRCRPPSTSVPQECLAKDFMCLYQDQDFSDFQLKCGDVSIPVHKNILSARSPVFKTMLSTDMREAASGTVDITDMDPSTLVLFLTYLYTGVVKDLQDDNALKLYYAADKYQVPSLKSECVSALRSSVSISNVCDILSLADKHQDVRLTSIAHDFILKNFNNVMKSQEWKSFMKCEPMLAVETVTHFAEQNRVSSTK